MKKECSNCYYGQICQDYQEEDSQVCDRFTYECETCADEAVVLYKDKPLCRDCLVDKLGIETWTVTHYMLDGEYLGNDGDNDADDMFGDMIDVEVIYYYE